MAQRGALGFSLLLFSCTGFSGPGGGVAVPPIHRTELRWECGIWGGVSQSACASGTGNIKRRRGKKNKIKGGGGEREKEQPYPSFGKVILAPTIGHKLYNLIN